MGVKLTLEMEEGEIEIKICFVLWNSVASQCTSKYVAHWIYINLTLLPFALATTMYATRN